MFEPIKVAHYRNNPHVGTAGPAGIDRHGGPLALLLASVTVCPVATMIVSLLLIMTVEK